MDGFYSDYEMEEVDNVLLLICVNYSMFLKRAGELEK